MLKNAKCTTLTKLLKLIYSDIINEGLVLDNFNISIITPKEKKDSNNKNPEDFRPISVSRVFSNIYEMIILNKIDQIFKFNNKQFGYTSNIIHLVSMHLSSLMKHYHILRREEVLASFLVSI